VSLPWVRFDTSLPDHPKILALLEMKDGHRSAFVYCCALAYAGKHGTDGEITRPSLSRVNGRPADADRLVEVGLWEATEKGWQIHGWLDRQQAAVVGEDVLAAKRKASRKGNCVRHHGEDCGCWRNAQ
jgi:hypothetical protein